MGVFTSPSRHGTFTVWYIMVMRGTQRLDTGAMWPGNKRRGAKKRGKVGTMT